MNIVIDNIKAIDVLEQQYTKIAIEKGYYSLKNSGIYTLTSKNFTLYSLQVEFYYPDDLDESTSKNEILLSFDDVEFWAETDNPVTELTERLRVYETVYYSTVNELKKNSNLYSMTINSAPVNQDDNFIFDFIKSWVGFYNKELLKIPDGLEPAYDHISGLIYKWRKMSELYNNIAEQDGLLEYLKENF